MGAFIKPLINQFNNLANVPTVIVQTDEIINPNWMDVESITFCNVSPQPIRISLRRITYENGVQSATNLLVNQHELNIPGNKESTINIVKDYGLDLQIQYENGSPPLTPTITDQLLCYSNGYTQIFDCEVNYISYKETPIT